MGQQKCEFRQNLGHLRIPLKIPQPGEIDPLRELCKGIPDEGDDIEYADETSWKDSGYNVINGDMEGDYCEPDVIPSERAFRESLGA